MVLTGIRLIRLCALPKYSWTNPIILNNAAVVTSIESSVDSVRCRDVAIAGLPLGFRPILGSVVDRTTLSIG